MFAPAGGASLPVFHQGTKELLLPVIVSTGPDEFIVVGKDFSATFTPIKTDAQNPKIDIKYIDEGTFLNGNWITIKVEW